MTKLISRSISRKLTLLYSFFAFLLITIAGLVLFFALVHLVTQRNIDNIKSEVNVLKTILEKTTDQAAMSSQLRQEIILEPSTNEDHYMARLITSTGKVLLETPGMKGKFPDSVYTKATTPTTITKGGKTYLTFTLTALANKKPINIQALLNITHDTHLIKRYQRILAILLLLNIFLAAIIGYLVTRNGLKPIQKINKLLHNIETDKLDYRLNPTDWPIELKETARGLNTMLDKIESSFERLTQFSSDIAHELRTPLNNIIGNSEITLSKKRDIQSYQKALASNLEESQKMASMIDSMLFIAKASSPQTATNIETIDARKSIQNIIDYYIILAEEKNISINISGSSNIKADKQLFKRAINNILSNAIKYTQDNGNINIEIINDNTATTIKITDNGMGIPSEDIPHLFDRFYRVDESRSRSQGGSGLGLAIVKSIMELHKGRISIESNVNQGTTVSLFFYK